jgi:hypothetical protein
VQSVYSSVVLLQDDVAAHQLQILSKLDLEIECLPGRADESMCFVSYLLHFRTDSNVILKSGF